MDKKKLDSPHSVSVLFDGENFMKTEAEMLKITRVSIKPFDFRYLCEQALSESSFDMKYYGNHLPTRPMHIVRRNIRSKNLSESAKEQWRCKMQEKLDRVRNQQQELQDALEKQGVEFIDAGALMPIVHNSCLNLRGQDIDTSLLVVDLFAIRLQEKGVDVRLAVDLVTAEPGSRIYLVSDDADFVPAIEASQAEIIYVGRDDIQPTRAIMDAVGSSFLMLKRQDIIEAYRRFNPNAKLPE